MGDTSWFFRGLATACPVCATALGEQVRSGIFGPDFLSNLLAIMLPFPDVVGNAMIWITMLFTIASAIDRLKSYSSCQR